MECWIILLFHKCSDHCIHPNEVWTGFTTQDLVDVELLVLWFRFVLSFWWFGIIGLLKCVCGISLNIADAVCIEPEFLWNCGISEMSSVHVFIWLCNWDKEIYIEMVDHIGDETHHYNETGVLEISDLDIHGSELDPPSDVGSLSWRWFESHWVPICRLNIFKVACDLVIINLIFHEFTLVCWYWVSDEELGNMLCKSLINSVFQ